MKKAVYPGSFDPPTKGHLDIIERASRLCDELVVGVLINENKQAAFTLDQRVEQLQNMTQALPNVRIVSFSGYLVDLLQQEETNLIVRGLRSASDVAYEQSLASAYKAMDSSVELIYLLASPAHEHISSTLVREGLQHGIDVSTLVPEANIQLIETQWGKNYGKNG